MTEVSLAYPEFCELYSEVFKFRYNPRELVGMFSDALRILDQDTVQYMIDDMRKELDTGIVMTAPVSFSKEWLFYIGASSKRKERGCFAGQFGEGFKIASLVAYRDFHLSIRMESKDWVLTITEAEDQIDGTKVMFLAYEISKRKYEDSFALILEVLDAEIALKVLCALKSKWNGVRRKNQSVDWRPVTRIGEEGRAEGEDAISKFYFKLAEQNRMEDLKRAMTDKEFRKKLRAEVNV